jgi:hypothetical protein
MAAEPEKLPVDFEAKAKLPPPANGAGYPYQLSAADLMQNFNYLLKRVPKGRSKGDILYWNGTAWTILPAPGGSTMNVLTCTAGALAWTETEGC